MQLTHFTCWCRWFWYRKKERANQVIQQNTHDNLSHNKTDRNQNAALELKDKECDYAKLLPSTGLVQECDYDKLPSTGLVQECDYDKLPSTGLVQECDYDKLPSTGLVQECDYDKLPSTELISFK